jgi:UDPglucose--hexose-1-phosphate uridylyltransferase
VPDLRQDPIIGRWVIIATDRVKRPTDFNRQPDVPRGGFCPLCPGNEDKTPSELFAIRDASTRPDTAGWKLRVVPNKFPVLHSSAGLAPETEGLYDKMNGVGNHEIILETPDHTATMSRLSVQDYHTILLCYRQRILELQQNPLYRYISIFKNYGKTAGSALEHPNSQLIALPIIPKRTIEELEGAHTYHDTHARCVYCDIIERELATQERLVHENDHFIALEPFAPRFPFETWILPRKHLAGFEHTDEALFKPMAEIFSAVFKKIDTALNYPPFNFILHTSPLDSRHEHCYHWHFEITPWLSQLSGFEWGTGFYINPTPPEEAARFLREADSSRRENQRHYFGHNGTPQI